MDETQRSALIFVRDTKLAACLITLGCPMPERSIEHVKKFEETFTLFYFITNERTANFVKAWGSDVDSFDDPGYPDKSLKDPEHPFWYCRAQSRNAERLIGSIKRAVQIIYVNKGGKTYVVTKNSPYASTI